MIKSFAPLIGMSAAALLAHVCSSLEDESSSFKNGRLWHRQTAAQTLYATGLANSEFRAAKQVLLDERLIETRNAAAGFVWWSLTDKFLRFQEFAASLRHAFRPDKKTLPLWQNWAVRNPSVVEEFRHLWPRLHVFSPEEKPALPVKQVLGSKPAKSETPSTNRWVEFWNSLPFVPKCRPGTQAYAHCRSLFEAHLRYEAGQCRGFMLTEDVQKKLRLAKINKKPEGRMLRTEGEMFDHIKQAALAYNPRYAPLNKKWLGTLENFLYRDGKWSKGGTGSYFLEKIAYPPALIEDESYQTIIDNADDWELDVAESIKRVYFIACGRDENSQLTLSELKSALSIARKIAEKYTEIPTDRLSILANHFPDYRAFMEWWRNYCEDHVWEGMPITALDPSKDMWRRFVDFVNSDIGWDIFTGGRIR